MNFTGGWGDDSICKYLLLKDEDLNSDPQHPHKCQVSMAYNPSAQKGEMRDP